MAPKVHDLLPIKTKPSSDDPHDIVYFRSPTTGTMPGREFLKTVPVKVNATMKRCLIAVAEAPPKKFAGGGYWEAMHGSMKGWYEIRVDGRDRTHHRLFCRLDYDAEGVDKPLLVIIVGLSKPFRTTFSENDYTKVRKLGIEYFAQNPRSIG